MQELKASTATPKNKAERKALVSAAKGTVATALALGELDGANAALRKQQDKQVRMGSPTLQALQEPILLTPWLCFRGGGFRLGSAGKITRAAGCAEARPCRALGCHQLPQRSNTLSRSSLSLSLSLSSSRSLSPPDGGGNGRSRRWP